jgi:hypothetical protein
MVIIRPTARLAKKLGQKLSAEQLTANSVFGSWYANCVSIGRTQLILLVSENTRLPILMKAAPYSSFFERFPASLLQLIASFGISNEQIRPEMEAMFEEPVFAKTQNKSVIGSLTDFAKTIDWYSIDPNNLDRHLFLLNVRLAETPISIFDYKNPQEITRETFGLKGLKRPINVCH